MEPRPFAEEVEARIYAGRAVRIAGSLTGKGRYCGSYKQYFEHVLRRLHADLTRARHQLDAPAS
jgi:hypothetical protein